MKLYQQSILEAAHPLFCRLAELGLIIEQIRKSYSVGEICEITAELNPDDVNPEYLAGLKQLNINRVSLGVQSWRDPVLKMLNRRHDSAQAEKALKDIMAAGFENISMDLIYGIPGMSLEEWAAILDFTFSFDIKHLSAYHLTFETGTVFGKMLEKGLICRGG